MAPQAPKGSRRNLLHPVGCSSTAANSRTETPDAASAAPDASTSIAPSRRAVFFKTCLPRGRRGGAGVRQDEAAALAKPTCGIAEGRRGWAGHVLPGERHGCTAGRFMPRVLRATLCRVAAASRTRPHRCGRPWRGSVPWARRPESALSSGRGEARYPRSVRPRLARAHRGSWSNYRPWVPRNAPGRRRCPPRRWRPVADRRPRPSGS